MMAIEVASLLFCLPGLFLNLILASAFPSPGEACSFGLLGEPVLVLPPSLVGVWENKALELLEPVLKQSVAVSLRKHPKNEQPGMKTIFSIWLFLLEFGSSKKRWVGNLLLWSKGMGVRDLFPRRMVLQFPSGEEAEPKCSVM